MTGAELYIGYGILNFVRVMFKAVAQLNVVNGHYLLVMPTSFALGTLEVVTWATPGLVAVQSGLVSWPVAGLCLVLGISGGLGAITAMKLHGVQPNE